MSTSSSRITRAMQRRMLEDAVGDAGLHSDTAAVGPFPVQVAGSHMTPPPLLPETGQGRVAEISSYNTSDSQNNTLTPAREGSQTSRTSQASKRLQRKQVELQAQMEIAKLREETIRKQMEVRIAEIEAEEEEGGDRGSSLADSTERVDAWLGESAGVAGTPALSVHEPVRRAPSAPLPVPTKSCVRGNTACGDFGRGTFEPATAATLPPRADVACGGLLRGDIAPVAATLPPRAAVACGGLLRGDIALAAASTLPPRDDFACGGLLRGNDVPTPAAAAAATVSSTFQLPRGDFARSDDQRGEFASDPSFSGNFVRGNFAPAAVAAPALSCHHPSPLTRAEEERRPEQPLGYTAAAACPQVRLETAKPPTEYPRDQTLERLTEAICNLARPQTIPRQVNALPRFDGNPADWLAFKRAYEMSNATFDIHPYDNISRLQNALTGDAKASVEDILRTCSDPGDVMKQLEQVFGNPNYLLECVMQKIRALPRLNHGNRELIKFTATVRNCVSTLRNIGAVAYLNNPQLIADVVAKLAPVQQERYGTFIGNLDRERGVDSRLNPNMEALVQFLNMVASDASYWIPFKVTASSLATQPASASRTREPVPQQRRIVQRVHTQVAASRQPPSSQPVSKEEPCPCCKEAHALPKCPKFRRLSVEERWSLVKESRLCFKCIERKHHRIRCRAKRCDVCNYGHHKLLHQGSQTVNVSVVDSDDSMAPEAKIESVTNLVTGAGKSLLKVIPVTILAGGSRVKTFALLDDGATVSLLDAALVKNATGPVSSLTVLGARGQRVVDRNSRREKVVVCGPNGLEHEICVRTMKDLDLPAQSVKMETLNCTHLSGLDLGEMENAKPMLLLGQDNWQLLVGWEIRQGKSGQPVASHTSLGWVIHGPIGPHVSPSVESVYHLREDELHNLVQRQFELEAIGVSEVPRENAETKRALGILDKTCRQVETGWEVGLLWNKDSVELPNNYDYALKRLIGIERKMDRSPIFAEAYSLQINRLLAEGYAKKAEDGFDAGPGWFLPHFGVVNPNKPGKLRLVFDAAAKYRGECLNDHLSSGPDLLNPLPKVLMNFRPGKIAFTGDIADMFLRVKVREQDQGAQRFLWRGDDRNKKPDTYVMTSMVFGATSSPTSAIYVLNRNTREFRETYPEAVHAIAERHYMDDYLDSADTVENAQQLIEEVAMIHAAGGFVIRGWVTNSSELRERLHAAAPDRVKLERSDGERTLGLIWSPDDDMLTFDLSFKRLPPGVVAGNVTPTKREFLSFIMSIFDPLGFLYPCVIQSRILMQRVWRSQISWDEELGLEEAAAWFKWLSHLSTAPMMTVPRWYGLELEHLELHIFGDASELAYAAVAYVVGLNENGNRDVAFVMGKARVAPVKVTSIPRLELQAAVLATRIGKTVARDFGAAIEKTYWWTDSRTVLGWINADARDYPRYISHRLGEIDEASVRDNWRWVPTTENPADEATKMDWPDKVSMWLSGPPFLRNLPTEWPIISVEAVTEEAIQDPELVCVVNTASAAPPLLDYTRFSHWGKALRTMARAYIFIARCRRQRASPDVTAEDLTAAEQRLLIQAQNEAFPEELKALRAGRELPRSSKIRKLDPALIGEDPLLRIRGRLSAAPDLTFGERHPVLLDGHHPIARLIIVEYHKQAHHAHHEAVVNAIRERFWVTRLRPAVRDVAHKCRLCSLRRALPVAPKMGDLPAARVTDTRRAFVHCGVDYFGPLQVAVGRRREKRWGVLFTCLTTRAVHLDLAATLSADSVILALRRLISRRGQPALLWSDRGTNFVGASSELRAALRDLRHEEVATAALSRGIEWRFNPPGAPHMGGSWERLVRAVKHALHVTLRERAPREEVLMTLLLEAELVVNSRPLTYVANDPEAPVAITPNHLILGSATGAAPFAKSLPRDVDARSQWRRVNAMADEFWRRWRREYLPTLQRREKWTSDSAVVKCGDICVLADNTLPRNVWPLGRILEIHPGSDGRVRAVTIKTQSGTLRRPLTGVVVLPD